MENAETNENNGIIKALTSSSR